MHHRIVAAVFAAFVFAAATACSSTCLKKDDRLVVSVAATANVNAGNGTPQPVQFRVWAVHDKAALDAAGPAKLVEGDVSALERTGLGKAFSVVAPWINPGGKIEATLPASVDEEFSHVAIAVRFPQPKLEVLALDCKARTGYTVARPEHRIAFTLDGDSIRVGGGEPAAR